MMRGILKRFMAGFLMASLVLVVSPGRAQQTAPDLEVEKAELSDPAAGETAGENDVNETYITPDLESMNLIWIQKGDVLRVGYVVQTGDTMWDIAGRYLNSPYYWPKIWERNSKVIINPHLIFPGDILYLYPEVVVEKELPPEEGGTVSTQPSTEKKEIEYQHTGSTGFVSMDELEVAGKIIDSLQPKQLLAQGDIVYVNIGKTGFNEVGDQFTVFRHLHDASSEDVVKIYHPVTDELIGYQVVNLGKVELTNVEAEVSEAKITKSYREIMTGDRLTPYIKPLEQKVEVIPTSIKSLQAYIIASKRRQSIMGNNDVVYLDVGKNDNVRRGHMFYIYEPCELIQDPVSEDHIRIPKKIIGRAVVLKPYDDTSVALISEAKKEVHIGERVLLSMYERWEIEGVSSSTAVSSCKEDSDCQLITEQEYEDGKVSPFCTVVSPDETKGKQKKEKQEKDSSEE
ncbi:MAG: LysM peptidoglycan-binding domain-containing protein [bacterium]